MAPTPITQLAQAAQSAQTDSPRIKVVTAAGGAGVGGAASVLILAALKAIGYEADAQTQAAIFLLAPLVLSYLAGYYTPPSPCEGVARTPDGKTVSAG